MQVKQHPTGTPGWCFVTGMPRSGTTFVASVLSAGPSVAYVHEPFNARCGIAGVDWSASLCDLVTCDNPRPRLIA